MGRVEPGWRRGPTRDPAPTPHRSQEPRHIGTWLWTTSYPQPAVTWGLARHGPYLSTGGCWSSLGGGRPRW